MRYPVLNTAAANRSSRPTISGRRGWDGRTGSQSDAPLPALLQVAAELKHVQCGHGGFDAFVAVLSTRPGAALVDVVVGQDAEDRRAVGIHPRPQHPG